MIYKKINSEGDDFSVVSSITVTFKKTVSVMISKKKLFFFLFDISMSIIFIMALCQFLRKGFEFCIRFYIIIFQGNKKFGCTITICGSFNLNLL